MVAGDGIDHRRSDVGLGRLNVPVVEHGARLLHHVRQLRVDLGLLPPRHQVGERGARDLRHLDQVDKDAQLVHQLQRQVAILRAVRRHLRALSRIAAAVVLEEAIVRHVRLVLLQEVLAHGRERVRGQLDGGVVLQVQPQVERDPPRYVQTGQLVLPHRARLQQLHLQRGPLTPEAAETPERVLGHRREVGVRRPHLRRALVARQRRGARGDGGHAVAEARLSEQDARLARDRLARAAGGGLGQRLGELLVARDDARGLGPQVLRLLDGVRPHDVDDLRASAEVVVVEVEDVVAQKQIDVRLDDQRAEGAQERGLVLELHHLGAGALEGVALDLRRVAEAQHHAARDRRAPHPTKVHADVDDGVGGPLRLGEAGVPVHLAVETRHEQRRDAVIFVRATEVAHAHRRLELRGGEAPDAVAHLPLHPRANRDPPGCAHAHLALHHLVLLHPVVVRRERERIRADVRALALPHAERSSHVDKQVQEPLAIRLAARAAAGRPEELQRAAVRGLRAEAEAGVVELLRRAIGGGRVSEGVRAHLEAGGRDPAAKPPIQPFPERIRVALGLPRARKLHVKVGGEVGHLERDRNPLGRVSEHVGRERRRIIVVDQREVRAGQEKTALSCSCTFTSPSGAA